MFYISRVIDDKYGLVNTDTGIEALITAVELLDYIFHKRLTISGVIVSSSGVKVYPPLEDALAVSVSVENEVLIDTLNDVFMKWILIGRIDDIAVVSIDRNSAVAAYNLKTGEQQLITNLNGNMYMPLQNFGVVGHFVVVLDKSNMLDGTEIKIFKYDLQTAKFVSVLTERAGGSASYYRSAYVLSVANSVAFIVVEDKVYIFDSVGAKLYKNTSVRKQLADIYNIGESMSLAYSVELLACDVQRVPDGIQICIRIIVKTRDNQDITAPWKLEKRVRDGCWLRIRCYSDGRPLGLSGVDAELYNPRNVLEKV